MSMDSPSGKSKKSKPSHLEFEFEDLSVKSPIEKPEELIPDLEEKKEEIPEMPFGKPISTHFEKESDKVIAPEPPSPLLKGTSLGSFKAQSTALPTKPIASPASHQRIEKETISKPLPPMETPMSSQIPSMSDFRRNAERQSKEQKATGSILSGIAYSLLAVIIIVASLSAFGGYVMWRQIQSQATTVAQLSDQLNSEVATLRQEAAQSRKTSEEAFRRQQESLNKLTVSLEQQRATFLAEQKKKDQQIQSLQSRVSRIESRFTPNR